jgi:cysteinyl-tRNA synthetase
MANFWMHNGFLQVEGEKMAKSLGNFFTVKDLLDRRVPVPGAVIRFVLLSAHYRQPLDWTEQRVEEAISTLKRWRDMKSDAAPSTEPPGTVLSALADDLNTPEVISVLHKLADEAKVSELRAACNFLGIGLRLDATVRVPGSAAAANEETVHVSVGHTTSVGVTMKVIRAKDEIKTNWERKIETLISLRNKFRKSKEFHRADSIRDALVNAGVFLEDTRDGTEWSISSDCDPKKILEISDE